MIHKLVFDTTDATSIADSANVGAYIRSSDGTLIDSASINSVDRLAVDSTLKDGAGTALTSTLEGGKQALDVYIANAIAVTLDGVYDGVTNTNPDNVGMIAHARGAAPADADQTFRSTGGAASADDVVAANVHGLDTNAFGMVFDGTAWDRLRGTSGAMHIHDGGNSITVDGTVSISGDVNVTQGTSPWVIGDGGGSITVDATNLDIRDLTHVSDSIRLGDGTDLVTTTTVGGDIGLDVNLINASLTVSDAALANTAISNASNSVTTTEEDLVASVLSDRKYLWAYNEGNKKVYLGGTGVTSANGFPLPPGSMVEMRAGAAVTVRTIAGSGTQDIRILQLS